VGDYSSDGHHGTLCRHQSHKEVQEKEGEAVTLIVEHGEPVQLHVCVCVRVCVCVSSCDSQSTVQSEQLQQATIGNELARDL